MQLGFFVGRLVDHDQQAGAGERQNMLVQVRIEPGMLGRAVAIARERGKHLISGAIIHFEPVARMERSEIRVLAAWRERPAFRFAPCGLRRSAIKLIPQPCPDREGRGILVGVAQHLKAERHAVDTE